MSINENTGCFTGRNTGSSGTSVGTIPEIISISAVSGGTTVTVTFDRAVDNTANFTDGFTFAQNSVAKTVSSASGDGLNSTITLTIATTFADGDNLVLTYTASGGTIFGRGGTARALPNQITLYTIVPVSAFASTYKAATSDNIAGGTSWIANATNFQVSTDNNVRDRPNYTNVDLIVDTTQPVPSGAQSFRNDLLGGGTQTRAGTEWIVKDAGNAKVNLNGKTIQLQLKTFFPGTFKFSSATPIQSELKFIRIRTRKSGKLQSTDFYLERNSSGSFAATQLIYLPTTDGANSIYHFGPTGVIVPDVWQTWTFEWVWSTNSSVSRQRVWVDKTSAGSAVTLIGDSWTDQTNSNYSNLQTTSDHGANFMIISYWNDAVPQNQSYWFKDVYYTDENNLIPFTAGVPDTL